MCEQTADPRALVGCAVVLVVNDGGGHRSSQQFREAQREEEPREGPEDDGRTRRVGAHVDGVVRRERAPARGESEDGGGEGEDGAGFLLGGGVGSKGSGAIEVAGVDEDPQYDEEDDESRNPSEALVDVDDSVTEHAYE